MYKTTLNLIILLTTVHQTIGVDFLDITGLRLADGDGPFDGRVEIRVDGVWGTICDYGFDINDAKVICRTLNLTATSYFTRSHYGQGKGPVFAQRFYCYGSEYHLRDCRFDPNTFCSHSRDIGVICTGCGEINIQNGNIQSISSDGSVLTASCLAGYQTNINTSVCQSNGSWSNDITCATSGYPLNITDIRLVSGIGLTDGIVELKVNGSWGQICRNNFDYNDAKVICKMLGFNYWLYDSISFGSTSNPYHLSKLGCTGTEDHINECLYDVTQTCSRSDPVRVECSYPYNITDIRLVEGTGLYDGRVEVKINDDWGTACSKYNIDSDDASTFCKMMNLNLTYYFTTSSVYGQGTGDIYTGYLYCGASSDHINQCNFQPPRRRYCSHFYDLGLVCTPCGEPKINHGSFESFNGTELTAKCNTGYQPERIVFDCLANGTWVQKGECSSKYSYPLNISDFRLVNSYGLHEGRVEIQVDGIWGKICSNNFTITEANVICRMFGLQAYHFSTSSGGNGPVFISNLRCNGTESHINNCIYDAENDCLQTRSAEVYCTGYQLNVTGLRLAGTNGPYHGRVEIEVNGTWGTICSRNFHSWISASVICNMLGLRYVNYFSNAYYGQGTGPIYIESLYCDSDYYSDIDDCKYVSNNYYGRCTHANDVSVMCYGPYLSITDVRLANGTGRNDGRAEIKVNDTWGTICDSNFGLRDAEVFCNMLDLKAVRIFTGALYGEGSGPVYIDRLDCDSSDVVLGDCQYLFLNTCSHSRDVSIVCNECGEPDNSHWDAGYFTYNGSTLYADCSYYKTYVGTLKMTCDNFTQEWDTEGECQEYGFPLDITDIRLSGGNSSSNGRVEIKSLDTWGTICDHGFGKNEADTICAMVGFPPAVTYHPGAFFGQGSGPIFVDDLQCKDDSTHINNCSYITYDNCHHFNDVSVVCTECPSLNLPNGNINSTSTHYLSVVSVQCEDGYNLIGDSVISCQLNSTWSSNPTCKLIDCGDPTPAFGSINTTNTGNGTVTKVSCDEGYDSHGETTIICQPNEKWTDYPSCIIKDCGLPDPANAEVTLSGNKTTFGETAYVSCNDGYQPGGSHDISCLANGTWEVWPECIIVDCGDPKPFRGKSNVTTFTYGTAAKIECETGYNISGNNVITCQPDGTWTDNPVCDTSDCGVLAVPNGEVDDSFGTTIGSNVTVTCNDGYELVGQRRITCTPKGWNETVECKIKDCRNFNIENGNVVYKSGGTLFGDVAEVSCNIGYNLNSSNVLNCLSDGHWNARPYCEIADCGGLPLPENGAISYTNGTIFNSDARFSCNSDYFLVGSATVVCMSDGKWSGDTPSCIAKSLNGGHCISRDNCLLEGSLCEDNTCVCRTEIYDIVSKKCDIMPLFSYGDNTADTKLSVKDDCGPQITFNPGIPVFGKTHKSLFVCSHGIVSFDNAYIGKHPSKKDKIISDLNGQVVLAPFHAQFRMRQSAGVYFRTYDILKSYSVMKSDESVKFIEKIVTQFGDMDNFKSSFVLIATWHEVKPQRKQFDRDKKSTFQLVLVTDGSHTFTFYIYGHNQIQWTTSRSKPRVWIGYSLSSSHYFTHPFAYTREMFVLLDARKSVAVTKSDVSGIIFKKLVHNENAIPNHAVDCINWYNENKGDKRYLDYIASLTPECPCDIRLSRFDPWFWHIGLHRNRNDKSHYCVDMLHRGNFGHFGKTCCYDLRTWLWVYQRPIAGSFQLYHSKLQREHLKNDIEPKENCCIRSNYCNLFYSLRPTGSCYRVSPYRFGTFWGDPHFLTLDGLNFTFNGIGEYTLLHVSTANMTFDLQARTDRTFKKDGNLTDATAFTAFAARDDSNASLHVQLNKARNGIIVYTNYADITSLYNAGIKDDLDEPFTYTPSEGNIVLARRDNALSVFFPTSGISLNISVSVQMLSISTILPNTLNNATNGLLGNFDGNPFNDLMMPNGSFINANSSERKIFDYGQTWEIDANKSAFIYEEGKTHKHYQNNSFTPRFLDEVNADKRSQAELDCNGAENVECVFDLIFTENIDVANVTSILKKEADQDRHEINETQPVLSLQCESINATLGQKVICPFSFDGGDDVYFIANNANAQINKTSSTVEYTQDNKDPVNIQVAVKNDNGRSSPGRVLDILLCTKCSGHGVCSNATRDDLQQTEYFKYSKCICESPYEGPDCEHEIEWCLTNPCSLERECTSLSPEEQLAQGKPYICAECPEGYVKDIEDSEIDECTDIDECAENTRGCEHMCVNTEGSFECSCYTGYRLSTSNTSMCIDINECEEALDNCSHICVNNQGGFSCECHGGYKLREDRSTCIADTVSRVCNDSSVSICDRTDGCTVDANGIANCFCDRGFELDASGIACKDIDECVQNVCPQICTNSHGNFTCDCFDGFYLKDSTICEACDATRWGKNCENECVCTGRGAKICDPVKGCLCDAGWEGNSCDKDINECNDNVNICEDPMKECVNNLGSYLCQCRSGFQEINGKCEDIDECTSPILHDCMQACNNAFGGYTCGCFNGYVEINETTCADIDECQQGIADCEHYCVNEPGFYNCFCNTGYILNDDRTSCEKVSDPCLRFGNKSCSHYCNVEDSVYTCKCRKGFTIGSDKQTCLDVNECEDNDLNPCDAGASCMNTYGSFTCECPLGTKLANDKRTCLVCDDFHFGKDCSQTCSCLNGFCDKKTGCVCDSGWIGDNCNEDIDECSAGLLKCTAANTICVNKAGGAFCTCRAGFVNVSNHCIDVDECDDPAMNSCNQICLNTIGSYMCKCQQGFTMVEGSCTDIDECGGVHDCDQICDNTIGGYRCSCYEGFALNVTERKSCSPINKCTDEKLCGDNAFCTVKKNETVCICIKGYEKQGNNCVDIDECSEKPCSHNCSNTVGSFMCACQTGYFLKEDMHSCQECDLFQYGTNCRDTCTCKEQNTDSCNPQNGECSCKRGWSGDTCEDDIDECAKGDDSCPVNSRCHNIPGSFQCKCDTGYLQTANGDCKLCDNGYFGENCHNTCECNMENTEYCNNVNGTCTCKEEWTGMTCLDDINECTNGKDPCSDVPNSVCDNKNGSYECKCKTGFRGLNNVCKDINECEEDAFNVCEQSCINTIGSFHCDCFRGYVMVDDVCKECSGNTFGVNCSETCDCVATNAENKEQMCDRDTGECNCKANWKGSTCAEDVNECKDSTVCSYKKNTTCTNNIGGYNCECVRGFRENADGECKECSSNTFGDNCTEECYCVATNAEKGEQTCDPVSGKCKCKSNWKGVTCAEDVNECEDTSLCDDKENTTCVNTQGWFQCECVRGFNENADGQCIEDGSFSPEIPKVAGVMTFNFSVTIDTNVLAGANLMSSNVFEVVKGKVEKSLLGFYSQYTAALIQIFVVDIRIGSIIVDYVVAFDEDTSVSSELITASAELIKGSELTFDGELVNVTSAGQQNMNLCLLYSVLIGSCDEDYQCEVSDNVPICRQKKEDDSVFHVIIIIISIVGGLLLFVGATIVIMYLRKKKQDHKKQEKHSKQRKHFDNNINQKKCGLRHEMRTSKSTEEGHENFYSKVLAWNQKRSGFTDLAGRDDSYNQPLHIPRAHIDTSDSFGIHNNGSDTNGMRYSRTRNNDGMRHNYFDDNGLRYSRTRNCNEIHHNGSDNNGMRYSRTRNGDGIHNFGFGDDGGRSYRPQYDDTMGREEDFNF